MKQLLFIKEKLKKFAGHNDVFLIPLFKFLITFAAMLQINSKIGFMDKIASTPIALIIGLAGSFLPLNLTIVILALIVVAHVYSLSMVCAGIVLVAFLILFLLYFRFASKDSVAVLLMPISFAFKIPYVLPISMGLVGTPSSMVSVASGVVVYYMIDYISINADDIASMGGIDSNILALKDLVTNMLINRDMIVIAASFAATVLVVYVIRRLSVKYSWTIAIVAGVLTCLFAVIFANKALSGDVSVGSTFTGLLISIIINIILQYFCFDLDYNRTEKVQFEDDEYYYYVKAVPKNTIKVAGKTKKASGKTVKENVVNVSAGERRQSVSTTTSSGTSQSSRLAQPERTAVRTPEAVQRSTSSNSSARPKPANSQKSFLGLSGGRPAGEGRLKEEAKRRELEK